MRDRRARKQCTSKSNMDIREELYERDILMAELGEELGMNQFEVSRMLKYELVPEDKQKLRDAMKRIEDARAEIKTSAAKVEACDALCDEENHQTYYITAVEVAGIFEKVLLHNCMKKVKYVYAFEYSPNMYDGRTGELTWWVQVRKTPSIEYAIMNGNDKMQFFGVFTTDEAAKVIEMIEADVETYDD